MELLTEAGLSSGEASIGLTFWGELVGGASSSPSRSRLLLGGLDDGDLVSFSFLSPFLGGGLDEGDFAVSLSDVFLSLCELLEDLSSE